jgi:Ankyrin repeats (3 copies)
MLALIRTRILEHRVPSPLCYKPKRFIPHILAAYLVQQTLTNPQGREMPEMIIRAVNHIISINPDLSPNREQYIEDLSSVAIDKSGELDDKTPSFYHLLSIQKEVPNSRNWNATPDQITMVAAACLGLLSIVNQFLDNEVCDNITFFGSALEAAATRGDIVMLNTINDHPLISRSYIDDAREQSAARGHTECLRILLTRTPSHFHNRGKFSSILQLAARSGHLGTMQFIRSSVPNFSEYISGLLLHFTGETDTITVANAILYWSVPFGHTDIVRQALDDGANINPQRLASNGNFRYSPIYMATEIGSYDTVELLLFRGAILRKDLDDNPLIPAAKRGWLKIAQLLVKYGAMVNPDISSFAGGRDIIWASPILQAMNHEQSNMVDFLLRNGAEIPQDSESRENASPDLLSRLIARLNERNRILSSYDSVG